MNWIPVEGPWLSVILNHESNQFTTARTFWSNVARWRLRFLSFKTCYVENNNNDTMCTEPERFVLVTSHIIILLDSLIDWLLDWVFTITSTKDVLYLLALYRWAILLIDHHCSSGLESQLTISNLISWIWVKNTRTQMDGKQTWISAIHIGEDCLGLVHGPHNPIAPFHGALPWRAYPQHLTPHILHLVRWEPDWEKARDWWESSWGGLLIPMKFFSEKI